MRPERSPRSSKKLRIGRARFREGQTCEPLDRQEALKLPKKNGLRTCPLDEKRGNMLRTLPDANGKEGQ